MQGDHIRVCHAPLDADLTQHLARIVKIARNICDALECYLKHTGA